MQEIRLSAIVSDSTNKILLLKRTNKLSQDPNKWELPFCTFTKDQSIKSTLEAELFRKYSIIVNVYDNSSYTTNNNNLLDITQEARYTAGNIVITIDENSQYEWVNLSETFDYELTNLAAISLAKYYAQVQKLERLEEPNERPIILVGRALIKNKDDKYLLLKRHESNSYPNTWELPGGKLNMLETIDTAIVREIFEETQLVVKVKEYVIYINSYIENVGRHRGYTYVNFVSDTVISSGKVKITNKHSAYKWATKKEIFELELAPYMSMQLSEIFLKKS